MCSQGTENAVYKDGQVLEYLPLFKVWAKRERVIRSTIKSKRELVSTDFGEIFYLSLRHSLYLEKNPPENVPLDIH